MSHAKVSHSPPSWWRTGETEGPAPVTTHTGTPSNPALEIWSSDLFKLLYLGFPLYYRNLALLLGLLAKIKWNLTSSLAKADIGTQKASYCRIKNQCWGVGLEALEESKEKEKRGGEQVVSVTVHQCRSHEAGKAKLLCTQKQLYSGSL